MILDDDGLNGHGVIEGTGTQYFDSATISHSGVSAMSICMVYRRTDWGAPNTYAWWLDNGAGLVVGDVTGSGLLYWIWSGWSVMSLAGVMWTLKNYKE